VSPTSRAPVLLIDGRSGSGKTELASAFAREFPHAELLRLDHVYPGWGGLEAGSAQVHEVILTQHRWRRWDWFVNELAEWRELDPTRPLIIEGCGAVSEANRSLAAYGIWMEFDDDWRKRRALDRDGEWFIPHWDEWAVQEEVFIARENPKAVADITVRGDVPLHESIALLSGRLRALGF